MAFIDWTTANEVGVREVDEQHKRLFAILNRLHASVVEGKEQGELYAIMDELIEYTVYHFDTEERLYRENDYPGYADHKAIHDDLTATVVDLQLKLHDGSATLSFELLDFLNHWLMDHTISQLNTTLQHMDHTMGLDREIGPFLNEKGVY